MTYTQHTELEIPSGFIDNTNTTIKLDVHTRPFWPDTYTDACNLITKESQKLAELCTRYDKLSTPVADEFDEVTTSTRVGIVTSLYQITALSYRLLSSLVKDA